jgi:type II secretory pathway pseudopilin PulG
VSDAKPPSLRHADCQRPVVRSQRGITLLVALIFLVLFAVMAGAVLNSTLTSSQAIGNMQFRSEAISAADDAIDQVLSSTAFAINTAGFTAQVNATPFRVDVNGDGADDITVNFPAVTIDGVTRAGPRCIRFQSIPLAKLDETSDNDIGCFGSSAAENSGLGNAETGGGAGTNPFAAGQSICANTDWVVPVRATEPATATSVDVVQGVGVRVFISDARNSCED